MTTKSKFAITLLAAALAATAYAQQPAPVGGVAVASEPGKAAVVGAVEISAQVVAIDKATRTVTLKGPKGKVVDIVAGEQVKNFDQIKVGDLVIVKFVEALTLELKPGGGQIRERIERENMASAKPGDPPAAVAGRTVTVIADVIGIDAAKQTVKLRGPKRTVDLKVRDPNQLKLIKVGDQVEATFTEAVAVSVEPAPKK